MKHLLLLVAMLFCSVSSVLADDSGSSSEQITVHVDKAGTLGDILTTMGYGTNFYVDLNSGPSDLKLSGNLNIADIDTIRAYAGGIENPNNGTRYKGFLKHLDMSNVQLEDGEGEAHYAEIKKYDYGTAPMVISDNGHSVSGLFAYLTSLQSVILPDSVTDVDVFTFCSSELTSITLPAGLKTMSKSSFWYKDSYGYKIAVVYAKNPYPAKCDKDVFKCFDKNCEIYVPKGSYWLYKKEIGGWGSFKIVDYDYMPTEELITRQFSVNVKEPGTLQNLIKDNVKYRLTNVKISGKLNIDDIEFIREMASCYRSDLGAYPGHLQYLNLKDAQFEASEKTLEMFREGTNFICGYAKIDFEGKLYGLFGFLNELKSVILPDDLTCIGNQMFCGCSGLTSLELPSGVTSIGEQAFSGCSGLTSLELPSGVTSIGKWAFSSCRGLTSFELPFGVTSIGNGTFSGCIGLTSLKIPSGVTSIGDDAFASCRGLTSLEIPGSVISIGNEAFSDCRALTSLNIPSGVASIGNGAFSGCIGLTSLKIPSGVTSIGDETFNGCSSLTSLELPSGVTSIGEKAFSDCSSLTSLEIPSSVTSIGNYAFSYCGLTSLELPSSVTSIGVCAFYNCDHLTSLEIPSSVTSIGVCAFYNCDHLTSLEIPSSLTSIEVGTFNNCCSLTSLKIRSGVTSIGDDAFAGCWGLTSLEIPGSVTSIGNYAFFGCSRLTSLSIPSSVTSIGDNAFDGCSNMVSLYSGMEEPAPVKKDAFYSMDRDKCTLYVPEGAFSNYIIATGWEYFNNIVEFDPTGIDSVTTKSDTKEVSGYSIDGQKLDAPVKGLNIVKYSDGTIKKVIVK